MNSANGMEMGTSMARDDWNSSVAWSLMTNHRNNTTCETNIWSRTLREEQNTGVSPHQGLLVAFYLCAGTRNKTEHGLFCRIMYM